MFEGIGASVNGRFLATLRATGWFSRLVHLQSRFFGWFRADGNSYSGRTSGRDGLFELNLRQFRTFREAKFSKKENRHPRKNLAGFILKAIRRA
ncbi:MAG: hypothetical protein U0931_38325 [Vulcanimicrobiota bacterium]